MRVEHMALMSLLAAFACLEGGAFAQEPTFELSLRESADSPGLPGFLPSGGAAESLYLATIDCVLSISGNGTGEPPTGWSLALTGSGVRVVGISTRGTLVDSHAHTSSFESNELTAGEGNVGALSIVRLTSGEGPLPAAEGETIIARLTVEGRYPLEEGACDTARLSFAERLRGASGVTVENFVRWRDLRLRPALEDVELELCERSCDDEVHVFFQSEPIAEAFHIADELFVHQVRRLPLDGLESTRLYAAFASDIAPRDCCSRGVWGWSLGIQVSGDVFIRGATTAGTAAAVRDGLRTGTSFELTELAMVPGGTEVGVVSAVLLAAFGDISLPRRGSATVLAMDVEALPPFTDHVAGRVRCRNGLRGGGQPVENLLSFEGESHVPCSCAEAVLVVEAPFGEFIRGDANDDGRVDLSDAVWILRGLFFGSPVTTCTDAADTDDDGRVTLTDGVRILAHLYRSGPPPEPPYPRCGRDPTDDTGDGFFENDFRCPPSSREACR